jgi:hypothetical protein
MTEDEWFGSNDFRWLGCYALDVNPRGAMRTGRTPKRKLRLVSCACVRSALVFVSAEPARAAIEFAEQYAEGTMSETEMEAMEAVLRSLGDVLELNSGLGGSPVRWVVTAVHHALGNDPSDLLCAADAAWRATAHSTEARLLQVEILRDVVCNPFRPVFFSGKWRTDTAVTLAQQMYESSDFAAMPILADALQDAGCDNEYILDHCRDPNQVHVRGCWVVDLVLGKG